MNDKEKLLQCRERVVPYGDDDAILLAFKEDGYVAVSDVLSQKEVDAALNELWTSNNLLGSFDRNDPETWTDENWPQQDGGRNFLSSKNVFEDGCNWDISSSPRQYHLQKLLWGRDDLIMSTLGGRWGVMRPSGYNNRWKTESSWLHWDHNPCTTPEFSHVQCIICLTESTPTSGGFACVPGFHKRFKKWGEDHPVGSVVVNGKTIDATYGDGQPFPVPLNDPCQDEIVQVLCPAGTMIFWDSRLPHQNVPNIDKEAFRVVFYCNMTVATEPLLHEYHVMLTQKRILMDLQGIEGKRFPHNLSELGYKLHGWACSESLSDDLAEFNIDDTEMFLKAARLVREAGEAEENGNIPSSIQKHQAALRAFPSIEDWHNMIFG